MTTFDLLAMATQFRFAVVNARYLGGNADREIRIEERIQRNGEQRWAVVLAVSGASGHGMPVLAKDGEWELEPIPSSRTDAFLHRTRYAGLALAISAAQAALGRMRAGRKVFPVGYREDES